MPKEMRIFTCNKYHWDTGYKFKDTKKGSYAIIPKQSDCEKTMFAPKSVCEVMNKPGGKVIVLVEEWYVAKFEFANKVNLN